MQPVTLLLLQQLLWPLNCSCYAEHLYAAQLIGSDFGDLDTPVTYDYVIMGGGTAGLVMTENFISLILEITPRYLYMHRSLRPSRTKTLQMKRPSIEY